MGLYAEQASSRQLRPTHPHGKRGGSVGEVAEALHFFKKLGARQHHGQVGRYKRAQPGGWLFEVVLHPLWRRQVAKDYYRFVPVEALLVSRLNLGAPFVKSHSRVQVQYLLSRQCRSSFHSKTGIGCPPAEGAGGHCNRGTSQTRMA